MLQELASGSGGTNWAIGSMLFFLAVYLVVAIRAFRSRSDDLDAKARLVFEDQERADRMR